jgi:hypothetical protein
MNIALVPALLTLAVAVVPVVPEDDVPQDSAKERDAETVWAYLSLKYDTDSDGRVSKKEYTRGAEHWKRLDKNADGFLDAAEFAAEAGRGGRRGPGGARGRGPEGERRPEPPKAGERAPDFELVVLPAHAGEVGEERKSRAKPKPKLVKLSSFKDKKPVALIFGSYT